jgi:hypothetical protein
VYQPHKREALSSIPITNRKIKNKVIKKEDYSLSLIPP